MTSSSPHQLVSLGLLCAVLWPTQALAHDANLAAWTITPPESGRLHLTADFVQAAIDQRLQKLYGDDIAMRLGAEAYVELVHHTLAAQTRVTADGLPLALTVDSSRLEAHSSTVRFVLDLPREVDTVEFDLLAFTESGAQRQWVLFVDEAGHPRSQTLLTAATGYHARLPSPGVRGVSAPFFAAVPGVVSLLVLARRRRRSARTATLAST